MPGLVLQQFVDAMPALKAAETLRMGQAVEIGSPSFSERASQAKKRAIQRLQAEQRGRQGGGAMSQLNMLAAMARRGQQ